MSVVSAFADGCQRVLRAPMLIMGLWLVYTLVPADVGVDLTDAHVAVIDATAIDPLPALIVIIRHTNMLAHVALVTFLLGGLMDRLARNRATASYGFFGACGMYFFRFLRLGVISLPIYLALLLWLQPLLPSVQPVNALLFTAILLLIHLVFDYAKVRMVVEDRRSAIGAIAAALRFIKRNFVAAISLGVLNAVLAATTWWLAATFDIGGTTAVYAYLLARALLRLIFIASQVSLFQSRLAHAGYTARPLPAWPDSPAADAVLPR
jgi:hypothetical protein